MQNYIKEWTPAQFKQAEKAIAKFMRSRKWNSHNFPNTNAFRNLRTFRQIDSGLGLAYTSSGIFACYSVCNDEIYLDNEKRYSLQYFVIDFGGFVHAIFKHLETEANLSFPINQ